MKIRCLDTLKINIGEATERETFTAGKLYDYLYLSSGFNDHRIKPNEGPYSTFNEEEFYQWFTLLGT